jgi:hypothetical protein
MLLLYTKKYALRYNLYDCQLRITLNNIHKYKSFYKKNIHFISKNKKPKENTNDINTLIIVFMDKSNNM